MKNKIIITNLTQVQVGDKAYFKHYDYGFTVTDVNESDTTLTLKVNTPLSEDSYWAESSLFDHATREVEEPAWPDPNDLQFHIYLGSDGKKYLYNPTGDHDPIPWLAQNTFAFRSREQLCAENANALPLQELACVPKVSES